MARLNPRRIVIFSGSGVGTESGLPTFRDADGLRRYEGAYALRGEPA